MRPNLRLGWGRNLKNINTSTPEKIHLHKIKKIETEIWGRDEARARYTSNTPEKFPIKKYYQFLRPGGGGESEIQT